MMHFHFLFVTNFVLEPVPCIENFKTLYKKYKNSDEVSFVALLGAQLSALVYCETSGLVDKVCKNVNSSLLDQIRRMEQEEVLTPDGLVKFKYSGDHIRSMKDKLIKSYNLNSLMTAYNNDILECK